MSNRILILLFAGMMLSGCKKLTDDSNDWNTNSNDLGYVFGPPKVQLISIEDQYHPIHNYHYGTITFQVDLSELVNGTGRSCFISSDLEFIFSGAPVTSEVHRSYSVTERGIQTCTLSYNQMAPDQDLMMDVSFSLNGITKWTTPLDLGHFY